MGRYCEQLVLHHVKPLDELSEATAQVHLSFALHKNVPVVEVSMSEESVQTPYNACQVLNRSRGNANSASKVFVIVQ